MVELVGRQAGMPIEPTRAGGHAPQIAATQLTNHSVLAQNGSATFIAPSSSVSRAIFWASITSPAGRNPFGAKHQPRKGRPFLSSSYTFCWVPSWTRYHLPVLEPIT